MNPLTTLTLLDHLEQSEQDPYFLFCLSQISAAVFADVANLVMVARENQN